MQFVLRVFEQTENIDIIISVAKALFNLEHSIFPCTNVENKFMDLTNFLDTIKSFPCIPPSEEEKNELFF